MKIIEGRHTFIVHPNGQRTHYVEDNFTDPWKPCETILIQHGFCRTTAHWYHWIPDLSKHYRVIRRDLRGHGLSSYPRPSDNYEYSLDTILGEIVDTLDQLEIQKVHFLGESTSGMLGEAFAAKYPERLHSLIICSSPTHLPPAAQKLLAFGRSSWPEACRELGSRGWATALTSMTGTVSSSDPGYIPWWIDQVAKSDGEGLALYAEFLSKLDARPFLEDIRVPMLILAPSSSAMVDVETMKELATTVKTAKLKFIDTIGHEIFVSASNECIAAVLEFLKARG